MRMHPHLYLAMHRTPCVGPCAPTLSHTHRVAQTPRRRLPSGHAHPPSHTPCGATAPPPIPPHAASQLDGDQDHAAVRGGRPRHRQALPHVSRRSLSPCVDGVVCNRGDCFPPSLLRHLYKQPTTSPGLQSVLVRHCGQRAFSSFNFHIFHFGAWPPRVCVCGEGTWTRGWCHRACRASSRSGTATPPSRASVKAAVPR